MSEASDSFGPDLTILEVLSRHRQTEAVFRRYDDQAGGCLCCQALFDTLAEAAEKYHLDMDRLLADLQEAAGQAVSSEQ